MAASGVRRASQWRAVRPSGKVTMVQPTCRAMPRRVYRIPGSSSTAMRRGDSIVSTPSLNLLPVGGNADHHQGAAARHAGQGQPATELPFHHLPGKGEAQPRTALQAEPGLEDAL